MDILLLQAENAGTLSLLIYGAMFLVLWLLFLRPQMKTRREQKKFSEDLEKGKEVVTIGGILGKITKIEEDVITLEVGTKVYIRVMRHTISKEMTDALNTKEKA